MILAGYSQGGMFAYQTAAFRRNKGIDSLVTFGSPVDANAPLPIPLSPEAASRLANTLVDSGLFRKVAVPGWFSRTGFKMLTPAKSVQDRVKFLLTLHDRDALLPRERQRRFLENDGWTAWSGPAVAQFLEMYFQHNRMLEGGFVIDDRLVTLADIDLPVLTVVGSTDTIGHPDSVRAIRRAAPSAEIYELTLRAGHFGLVVGSTAMTHSWPAVADWARWRRGEPALPDTIVPADQVETAALRPPASGAGVLTQATELGVGAGQLVVDTARAGRGSRGRSSARRRRRCPAAAHRTALPVHPDQPRSAARRAGAPQHRRDLLPVRRPRAPAERGQEPRRRHRQGPDRDRRAARRHASAC